MKTRSVATFIVMSIVLLALVLPGGVRTTAALGSSSLNKVFVAIQSPNSIAVLDTTTNSIIQPGVAWPKPPHSGAVTPDGSHVFLLGHGDGTVYGMRTDTYERDTTIPLAGCDQRGIAISSDGLHMYVADNCLRQITPIDLTTNTPGTPISLTAHPEQIALSPDGSHLYVAANFPDTDFVIDTNTRAVTSFAAGANAHGVAVSPDGQSIYIANSNDGTISVVAAKDLSVVKTMPVAEGMNHLTLTPDGATLYATNYQNAVVSAINILTAQVTAIPVTTTSPSDAALSEDGTKLFVGLVDGTVAVIATNASTIPQYVQVGGLPVGVMTKPTLGNIPLLPEIDYFALGDSIASGHGLLADSSPCHRSNLSYPSKVHDMLRTRYTKVYIHHLACSGATALKPKDKVLAMDKYKWFHNQVEDALAQIKKLPSTRPILVSITIGINDFGWDDFTILQHVIQPADTYLKWVNDTKALVVAQVRSDVDSLINQKNVKVVITQYHNPFNTKSIFFVGVRQFRLCNDVLSTLQCYDRTEYLIHSLNNALFLNLVSLEPPDRINMTSTLHATFHGHESPQPSCGSDPPSSNDTWVQYPGDPNSNGEVPLLMFLVTGKLYGDCFHPNEKGAQAYASVVNTAANTLHR